MVGQNAVPPQELSEEAPEGGLKKACSRPQPGDPGNGLFPPGHEAALEDNPRLMAGCAVLEAQRNRDLRTMPWENVPDQNQDRFRKPSPV